jgi:hypothetical protein
MKLRINSTSIRLRLLRSEVAKFVESGRIEEKIQFAPDQGAFLVYALECESGPKQVEVRYKANQMAVVLPRELALSWAQTEEVGVYASVEVGGHSSLEVVVEKDFACLDRSDADNQDTFPHPQMGAVC